MYKKVIKRIIDLVAGLVAFVVLSPVFVLVAAVLAFANRGRVFFTQPRPGKGAKVFYVVKFRTMNDRRDARGDLLPDAQRLTTVGGFVRKTSLDEIPQLLNVIKGDMSLVGPRPLLVEYLDLYSQEQRRRHEVRPGITGWAQVNGRNTISWKEKFSYDVWYIDHLTFGLDMRILFMTLAKVMKAEGISGRGVATAEKFNGAN